MNGKLSNLPIQTHALTFLAIPFRRLSIRQRHITIDNPVGSPCNTYIFKIMTLFVRGPLKDLSHIQNPQWWQFWKLDVTYIKQNDSSMWYINVPSVLILQKISAPRFLFFKARNLHVIQQDEECFFCWSKFIL